MLHTLRPIPILQLMCLCIRVDPIQHGGVIRYGSYEAQPSFQVLCLLQLGVVDVKRFGRVRGVFAISRKGIIQIDLLQKFHH